MATRQLKINGFKVSEVVSAEISVNEAVVFSGEIGIGLTPVPYPSDPGTIPGQSEELIIVNYEGSEDPEVIAVQVKVTDGSALIGTMFNDLTDLNNDNFFWTNQSNEDINLGDGRTDIKIDGIAPAWPTGDNIAEPGGTFENPAWTGYCFLVATDSVLSCHFKADYKYVPVIAIDQ